MGETNVSVTALKEEKGKIDYAWSMQITNNSGKIAFFIRPQIMLCGEEILPSFWSESYFTLAPGESTAISVTCPASKLTKGDPALKVSGWNVPVMEIPLPKK